ncbi:MAG: hypothetical protein ACR2GN_02960 [Bacteroidia bacterium]
MTKNPFVALAGVEAKRLDGKRVEAYLGALQIRSKIFVIITERVSE